MSNCGQACTYNTLNGCKVKEYNAICPMSNLATNTQKPHTNADRIRAMSDEELADYMAKTQIANVAEALKIARIPWEQHPDLQEITAKECLEWLKQPAETPPITADTCVCCGAIIPEGQMVCPNCLVAVKEG